MANLSRILWAAAQAYEERDLAQEAVDFRRWARMRLCLALSDAGVGAEAINAAASAFVQAHALGECGDRECPCVGLAGCGLCEEMDGVGADCSCEADAA